MQQLTRASMAVMATEADRVQLRMTQFQEGQPFWVSSACLPAEFQQAGKVLFCLANVTKAIQASDLIFAGIREPSPNVARGAQLIYEYHKVRELLEEEKDQLIAESDYFAGFNTELRDSRGKDIGELFK